MIFDKFFESVYNVASRYVTLCRIFCFVFAMLVGSDKFYQLIFSEFWIGSAADFAEALLDAITKAPLWIFIVTFIMAFYVVPLISKITALKILESELQQVRVSALIETVDIAVHSVPLEAASEELKLARLKAEFAEKKILRYKSLLEIFSFWVFYGLLFFVLGKASFVVVLISLSWPFLCWRVAPYILNDYIRWIYYYKQLAVRVGSGIIASESGRN
ncbi:hypothetical protein ABIA54_001083 [Pseudomonas sp. EB276 TE3739]|uniref:hypothetical protein n=1 Tax=Pseudomonas TaxID=286 RepID=UPI00209DE8C4|nr:hypothetical protein [Pseudomonas koreensis]MCP1474827.1 hypothetical protein [Pseudomonas koreensis]